MMEMPESVPAVSDAELAAFLVASALAAIVVACFDFVPVLDHVNLAFHEAGHPILRLFGETLGWLGGSLFQFVFPTATAVHFLRRGQRLSAAACAMWFCENLRYLSFYVGDARAQALPLVGGGEHDWAYLLGRWGLLDYDTRIAGVLAFLAWAGFAAVWGWLAREGWQRRQVTQEQARVAHRQAVIEAARERERERQARRGPPGTD